MNLNPAEPSSANLIGGVEDNIATQDLIWAYQALRYVAKAEEIDARIEASEMRGMMPFILPDIAVGYYAERAVIKAVNIVRNRRANYFMWRGMTILSDLEDREYQSR